MYPRSGFRSGGTCARALVPVFVLGEHPNVPSFWSFVPGEHLPKPPFWKTTLLATLVEVCAPYLYAGNLTGWVAFRLEDVRETEGEKQN